MWIFPFLSENVCLLQPAPPPHPAQYSCSPQQLQVCPPDRSGAALVNCKRRILFNTSGSIPPPSSANLANLFSTKGGPASEEGSSSWTGGRRVFGPQREWKKVFFLGGGGRFGLQYFSMMPSALVKAECCWCLETCSLGSSFVVGGRCSC